MGWKKCSVPGCSTKVANGKVFKQLPSNPALKELWLKSFPKDIRVTKSLAICEDHFDSSQFERVRADGKKKLKFSAVPFSVAPARRPLSDLTNCQALQAPDRLIPVPTYDISGELEAANALLSFSHGLSSPEQHTVEIQMDTDIDTNFNPTFNSTFIGEDDSSVTQLASREDGTLELDGKTGTFKLPLQHSWSSPPCPDSPYVNQECEVQFVATWSDCGASLDEKTGEFVFLSPDSHDNPSAEVSHYSKNRAAAIDAVMALVAKGQAEVECMRRKLEEKDEKISQLQSEVDFLGGLSYGEVYQKKCEALRKENARLKQNLNNANFSPWLSTTQMARLKRNSNRGFGWEMKDIRDGLILKMKCGSSGYQSFVQAFPLLPSLSVLKQTVQFVKFESGLLDSVFDMMENMLKDMPVAWRDCELVLDELALKPEERWCNTLGKYVGMATLPTHSGLATKGLVVLLAGIQKRWKMSVAVFLSNKRSVEAKKQKNNPTGKAYSNIIDSVLLKAKSVGANVVGITSDMGADNLALWKQKGITGGRGHATVVSSFPNPAQEGSKVFVLPDPVHLMKAVKAMMESNETITIPEDIVEEEGLPSGTVSYHHIDDLYEYECDNELKVAFRLRDYNIHCKKHFEKMNVGTAKAVLCHRTGVGLKLLGEKLNDPSYETTSWFLLLLNTFFQLVLCRHSGLAVSKWNENAFNKATRLISKVADIFHRMRVGKAGDYKPSQRGMRVLCNSLLGLVDYFLETKKYSYLILGRFSSDCIENLFSCIRLCQAIPNAAIFYQCLKVITLAQYSQAVKGSNYDFDGNDAMPGDFLEIAREKARDRALAKFYESLDEMSRNTIRRLEDKDYKMLNDWEKMVVYDMAGSVIAAIIKSRSTVCDNCIHATKWNNETPHPFSVITQSKEYTELRSCDDEVATLQVYVSDFVFHSILTAEISFRLYREKTRKFQHADVKKYFVENLMYLWTESSCIPNCHDLGRKILTTYFDGRLKEFGKLLKQKANQENQQRVVTVDKSSKSVCMHDVVDKI